MNKELDTTFRATDCLNKRVIEWIDIKDKLPETTNKYLVYFDHIELENAIGFSSFFTETKEFNHTNVTHWADISQIGPTKETITTCEHSGVQFNEKGNVVSFL